MASRVTQVVRNTLTLGEPAARVTQVVRNTLTLGQPAARVTQVARVTLVMNSSPNVSHQVVDWNG